MSILNPIGDDVAVSEKHLVGGFFMNKEGRPLRISALLAVAVFMAASLLAVSMTSVDSTDGSISYT